MEKELLNSHVDYSTDVIALTKKLISFDTVNPPGNEKQCAHFVGDLLKSNGVNVEYYEHQPDRTSVLARVEGTVRDKLDICFTGHLDTVPLGTADWELDPFKGEIVDGKMFGRGVSDMKAGVAAMILSTIEMAKEGCKNGINLLISSDEEVGAVGVENLAKDNMLTDVGAMIIGEPTGNYPIIAHKGSLWVEATTHGVTAHGSFPHKGDNAIYKAAAAVKKLEGYNPYPGTHELLGHSTLNVGSINGGINVNSVPDFCDIRIDIRTIAEQTNNEVFEKLRAYLGEDLDYKKLIDVESISTSPNNPWVKDVYKIMTPYLQDEPKPRGINYFTDGSILKPAMGNPPTIILGPGEGSQAHSTNEWCYVSKIQDIQKAYTDIARKWCS